MALQAAQAAAVSRPSSMENFASTLDYQATRRPGKVVLTHEDRTLTNAQLLARVNALANALGDLGVGRGDIVGLLLFNCVEFIELVYAVNRIGAAFLPLNYRLAPDEWRYILDHGEVRLLVSEEAFAVTIDQIVTSLPTLRHRVLLGPGTRPGWAGYEELIAASSGRVIDVADVGPDDLQRLMYTSGTTSRPKGVMISHRNLIYKNLGLLVQFGWTDCEISMVSGPLYHVGGLDLGGLAILQAGGSLVLQRNFDAASLVDGIERHRVTSVWLAPAMINAVLQVERLGKADLSSLRLIMSGGEKMPESRLRQVLETFPGIWFADAYGLTETVSSDTFVPPEHVRDKLGSVGRPMPHVQVRVVDPIGRDVAVNEIGEVALRGPKVFIGYWRDPAATRDAIRDGWFHTGDMGRLDEDGFLYIEDRKKDMILSGGENIATPEVERVLYEHPAVLEAAVIGQPDERWGEVPRAFVVLRPGVEAVTPQEIIEFCRGRLAKFKIPVRLDIMDALPRTPSGKVLKRNLRASAEAETTGAEGSDD
jgi:fatty-acyl-CoA synthase